MTLAMMFIRSSLEMVKMDPEDWAVMGWTLLVLATVAEMETAIFCVDNMSRYYGQNVCKNYKNICWIVGDDCCKRKKTCPYSSFKRKIWKNGLQKWNLCEKLGKKHLYYKKSTVNSQSQWSTTMMTSARWCNLMTSARADVVVMTSAMTSTSDQRRVRRVIQFSPKLWSTREGTWSIRWGQFFSGDIDQRKTISMTATMS